MSLNSKFFAPLGVLAFAACFAIAPAAVADTPVKGSIRLPATMKENPKATEIQLNAESKKLARFAKLTPNQAISAARKRATGKIDKIVLENEDGYLCYAVFLGGHEVLVDAGNGKILGDERESPTAHD
jgi:uncharacterized membrane protein YkoI